MSVDFDDHCSLLKRLSPSYRTGKTLPDVNTSMKRDHLWSKEWCGNGITLPPVIAKIFTETFGQEAIESYTFVIWLRERET